MLSRLVIAFLPSSKCILTSWLQSPSTVILEPKKIKSVTASIFPRSICHKVMGPDAMILIFGVSFVFESTFFFNLTLQYCIGFAIYQNESATGIHVFPILNPPLLPPHTILWVVPVHQPQASSIIHRTWTGNSFHIWYYTYFNAILLNHPTLSLSHRVQKTVLYISVSFTVSYTGLLLPSF